MKRLYPLLGGASGQIRTADLSLRRGFTCFIAGVAYSGGVTGFVTKGT